MGQSGMPSEELAFPVEKKSFVFNVALKGCRFLYRFFINRTAFSSSFRGTDPCRDLFSLEMHLSLYRSRASCWVD